MLLKYFFFLQVFILHLLKTLKSWRDTQLRPFKVETLLNNAFHNSFKACYLLICLLSPSLSHSPNLKPSLKSVKSVMMTNYFSSLEFVFLSLTQPPINCIILMQTEQWKLHSQILSTQKIIHTSFANESSSTKLKMERKIVLTTHAYAVTFGHNLEKSALFWNCIHKPPRSALNADIIQIIATSS